MLLILKAPRNVPFNILIVPCVAAVPGTRGAAVLVGSVYVVPYALHTDTTHRFYIAHVVSRCLALYSYQVSIKDLLNSITV